jgi:sugar/nucleoside kinase (ribokinase family)
VFLGWVTIPTNIGPRQFYVRQLRDAKIKPLIETFDSEMLTVYAGMCGRVLARAHAKTGAHCLISGYVGTSDQFDQAIADFALAYADQTERDHLKLVSAVKNGKVKAYQET